MKFIFAVFNFHLHKI